MPGVDWGTVETDVLAKAEQIIGGNWQIVSTALSGQVKSLIACGVSIEQAVLQNPPAITPLEYDSLKLSQQRALEGIASAYAAIGIVTAEQVAAAAWTILATALKKAYPVIGFLVP